MDPEAIGTNTRTEKQCDSVVVEYSSLDSSWTKGNLKLQMPVPTLYILEPTTPTEVSLCHYVGRRRLTAHQSCSDVVDV